MNKSTKVQIRNVLLIFISAIACAGFLATYMLFYYGPTGRYIAGNTILSPYIMDKINYSDINDKRGKGVKFVYNGTELTYFSKTTKKQETINIDFSDYEKFYNLVIADVSMENVPDSIRNQFSHLQALTMTVTMRTDTQSQQVNKLFQMIQIVDTDYFRVQLKDKENADNWAYFYRPKIYQEALSLFTKNH